MRGSNQQFCDAISDEAWPTDRMVPDVSYLLYSAVMHAATSTTRALVTHYLQALAARDIPALVKCFADSVDWYIPGAQELAPWLGARQSRTEIRQFFEQLFTHTVPVAAHVEHLLVADEVAVITGSFTTIMR